MTQKKLKELFDYHPDGFFLVKKKTTQRRVGDKIKGFLNSAGYPMMAIGREHYRIHRMIFLWHHGFIPEQIDHINRKRSDNRVRNLRAANKSLNMRNASRPKDNTSGYKGVSWLKTNRKWRAYAGGIHIGCFSNKIEAAKAYDKKAIELFGNFACINFPD